MNFVVIQFLITFHFYFESLNLYWKIVGRGIMDFCCFARKI